MEFFENSKFKLNKHGQLVLKIKDERKITLEFYKGIWKVLEFVYFPASENEDEIEKEIYETIRKDDDCWLREIIEDLTHNKKLKNVKYINGTYKENYKKD